MYGVNQMRFAGLATGLDTNQIIKDMMRVERLPLDRLQQKRQILEWQRDDYREINTLLSSFRNQASNMRLQSTFLRKTVVSSNANAASVSVVGQPSQSMYTVEVRQLAQAGKHASATFQYSVEDPLQELGGEGFSFSINGALIEVESSDTVISVVDEINRVTVDTGVKAEVIGKQLVLKSVGTVEGETFDLTVIDGDASVLGFNDIDITEGKSPQQAEIVINGVTLRSDTNRFTYDGVQIDVKQLTAGQPVNLSISQDVDAVFEQIKGFVEAYNELIEKVQQKLGEERYRDYPPLTDEQREQLSESEIEKWEERARSGLIKNDPLVSGIMNDLRTDFYSAVDGVGHLSNIGITVGSPEVGYSRYRDGGKLYIDEAKLREAISSDPELVMNLFTNGSSSTDEATAYKETGVTDKAGLPLALSEIDNSFMGERLRDMDNRIYDMERRLLQIEDRYWQQFTALEKAMERLNQQNNWLMGQLGSMQG